MRSGGSAVRSRRRPLRQGLRRALGDGPSARRRADRPVVTVSSMPMHQSSSMGLSRSCCGACAMLLHSGRSAVRIDPVGAGIECSSTSSRERNEHVARRARRRRRSRASCSSSWQRARPLRAAPPRHGTLRAEAATAPCSRPRRRPRSAAAPQLAGRSTTRRAVRRGAARRSSVPSGGCACRTAAWTRRRRRSRRGTRRETRVGKAHARE